MESRTVSILNIEGTSKYECLSMFYNLHCSKEMIILEEYSGINYVENLSFIFKMICFNIYLLQETIFVLSRK